jgi:hypothetical protein
MPQSKEVVKRPELSQEQEKRFNDATKAVQEGMALHIVSKNCNVPQKMLH